MRCDQGIGDGKEFGAPGSLYRDNEMVVGSAADEVVSGFEPSLLSVEDELCCCIFVAIRGHGEADHFDRVFDEP